MFNISFIICSIESKAVGALQIIVDLLSISVAVCSKF